MGQIDIPPAAASPAHARAAALAPRTAAEPLLSIRGLTVTAQGAPRR